MDEYANDSARHGLADCIRSGTAFLLAGSGNSKFAGYPLWGELIKELWSKFVPPSAPKVRGYLDCAQLIRESALQDGRIADYYNHLERRFEPKNLSLPDYFTIMVRLPFCGIVTTNYDEVLEQATTRAFSNAQRIYRCEALDLCGMRKYRVVEFLRGLGSQLEQKRRWVLHIHGHYRDPKSLILTCDDYNRHYGTLPEIAHGQGPLVGALHTMHRKVLWSLLACYRMVSVGFSLDDEFFQDVLRTVRDDFEQGSDPVHFAVLPSTDATKLTHIDQLRRSGVTPIFYSVTQRCDGCNDYESGFGDLMRELAVHAHTPVREESFEAIARRMLEQ